MCRVCGELSTIYPGLLHAEWLVALKQVVMCKAGLQALKPWLPGPQKPGPAGPATGLSSALKPELLGHVKISLNIVIIGVHNMYPSRSMTLSAGISWSRAL